MNKNVFIYFDNKHTLYTFQTWIWWYWIQTEWSEKWLQCLNSVVNRDFVVCLVCSNVKHV